MRLVLGKEIALIDRMACKDYGISGLWLMENAGKALADFAQSLFAKLSLDRAKPVILLAGGGNNGGDALVVARLLAVAGYKTETFLLCSPEKYKGDAAANWQRLKTAQLPFTELTDEADLRHFAKKSEEAVMIIDGIFGTGFHGAAEGIAADVIEIANKKQCVKLAVDLPSGVNADNGTVRGAAFRADYTVTFGWGKYGTKIYPAKAYVGKLNLADIGLPVELLSKIESNITEIDDELAGFWLPDRSPESHKGTYGHVAVVGGAYGMLGAAILAADGALKSGAGLVTAVSVSDIMVPLACRRPEIMCRLQKAAEGFLTEKNKGDIAEFIADKTVVMGMGMGRKSQTLDLIRELWHCKMKGLVLDADGLYALAENPVNFKECGFPVVLTPHPKEMAGLLGVTTAEVQSDRLGAVQDAAEKYGAAVVLKGANTLIADEDRVYLSNTGNAGMATGGSGDVLGGMIAGFLAQGLSAEKAAALGVYFHGRAGDFAKAELGEYGMSAGNLIDKLPLVLADFEKSK
ncbi:MAG: NAD(P)H-hydrate dehydratase [Bacillota bacterium]|jgi:hydroxyethylthiazole kinase-like uncharacterized protein yjeF